MISPGLSSNSARAPSRLPGRPAANAHGLRVYWAPGIPRVLWGGNVYKTRAHRAAGRRNRAFAHFFLWFLAPKLDRRGRRALAFTLAPHLQIINYRGRFWGICRHLTGFGNTPSRLTERSLN